MRPFRYVRPDSVTDAVHRAAETGGVFVAGGTDVLNLMKDNVIAPEMLIDINGIDLGGMSWNTDRLRIGALTRMGDVANDPLVAQRLPLLVESLLASASGQVRAMASIGGNLLQRTRCWYFRDAASACNTRSPGSGCPAPAGQNRWHAVFGGSASCIKVHPSDLAVALTALDASVHIDGPHGTREVPIADFYRLPADTPQLETQLRTNELIVAVDVPLKAPARSRYVKVRDRASFEFALVSLAAVLETRSDIVTSARIVFGGVAPVPWRARAAEDRLTGQRLATGAIRTAADAAVVGATPQSHNGFKIELMRATLHGLLSEWGAAR